LKPGFDSPARRGRAGAGEKTMTIAPVTLLVLATGALGGWLLFRYLMGERNSQVMVGLHFLMGAGALEVTALVLRGPPNGLRLAAGGAGGWAAGLLAAALLTGVLTAVIARPLPRGIAIGVWSHAGVATLAIGAVLVWAIRG
jgi:hypothetical protein